MDSISTASISTAEARRIALAAQGFTDARPSGVLDRRHLRRVIDRVGLLQIDSVNVLQRAHYLPVYSRIGAYDTALVDRAAYTKPRTLFEYWGHEASLLPVELYPLMRWRMQRFHQWGGVEKIAKARPGLVEWVRDEVADKGPITAAQIEVDAAKPSGNWGWNWSDVKAILEYLFWRGELMIASRNTGFARLYDIPERVLPKAIVAATVPDEADAIRELVRRSARQLGVANEKELRDYYRVPVEAHKVALRELVDAGELVPVTVGAERGVSYVAPSVRVPRRVAAATLVSPFDPIVWNRGRTERLFDFHYRIEIYVPADKRVHGYYVLPFLLGDRLAARVDLKADRQAGVLRVPAAWAEPGAPAHTAPALAAELHRLAGWLGLDTVAPPVRGDLAQGLATALKGVTPGVR